MMYKVDRYTTASHPGLVVTYFGMSDESGQTRNRGAVFFCPKSAFWARAWLEHVDLVQTTPIDNIIPTNVAIGWV